VSANEIKGGLVAYIACGGGYYTANTAGKKHKGDPIFDYAGKDKPVPPSLGTVKAPQALRGWHDLRKSVNKKMPAATSYSHRLGRASLRALSRAHKVKL
jgi:hypothetical protein